MFGGITNYILIEELDNITDILLFNYLMNSYICINYAGMLAEKQHFKNVSGSSKFPKILQAGCETDFKEASKIIKTYSAVMPGKKRSNYKKRLINSTLKKLNIHWDAVTLVAHALYSKKRLNFIDLKNLLTKKSKNKQFWKNQFKLINMIFKKQDIDELKIKSILSL